MVAPDYGLKLSGRGFTAETHKTPWNSVWGKSLPNQDILSTSVKLHVKKGVIVAKIRQDTIIYVRPVNRPALVAQAAGVVDLNIDFQAMGFVL